MKKQMFEAPGGGSPQKWLYVSGIAILVAGLLAAALIYKTAADFSKRAQDYQSRAGEALPSPDNSKQYLRELQLYGGTANVLAYELRTWFAGLWEGESLAYTIIFITLLVSSGIFYVASRLPSGAGPDSRREDPGGTGRDRGR